MSDAMDAMNNLIAAMEGLHPVRFDEPGWQKAKENLRACVRALEDELDELAEYRGLIDGDVDKAWRELTAERDALKHAQGGLLAGIEEINKQRDEFKRTAQVALENGARFLKERDESAKRIEMSALIAADYKDKWHRTQEFAHRTQELMEKDETNARNDLRIAFEQRDALRVQRDKLQAILAAIDGRAVHTAWRDAMLEQGRPVASERMRWTTLSNEDKMLDHNIAERLAGRSRQKETVFQGYECPKCGDQVLMDFDGQLRCTGCGWTTVH